MATAVATTIPYIFPSSDIGYPGTGSAFLAERDHVPTTVNDARGRESSFSLDRQGFEFHGHTASEKEFPDDKERIKASYYPEIVSLIKEKYVSPFGTYLPAVGCVEADVLSPTTGPAPHASSRSTT